MRGTLGVFPSLSPRPPNAEDGVQGGAGLAVNFLNSFSVVRTVRMTAAPASPSTPPPAPLGEATCWHPRHQAPPHSPTPTKTDPRHRSSRRRGPLL